MKSLLAAVILSLSCKMLMGCSCLVYSFCETASQRLNDVVLLGKIIDTFPHSVKVQVLDILRGSEHRDTITIWDGTDFDCNGIFPMNAAGMGNIGDTILTVLPLIDTMENVWDIIGDYRRPFWFCHVTELTYQNDSIRGFISGYSSAPPELNIYVMHYDDFRQQWLASNNSCMNIVGMDDKITGRCNVRIVPNPTHDVISVSASACNISHTVLYSASGKMIIHSSPDNHMINIAMLERGLYFMKVTDKKGNDTYARFIKW
jgi:hypothetical protein